MKKISSLAIIALLFLFPQMAFAVGSSGFENASYSARSLAQANAVVARPGDPSTALANPAGLVELKGVQASASLQQLDWRIFHTNEVTGDHNQNNAKLLLIPGFAASVNPGSVLNNRLAAGIMFNAPFGLDSSFPSIGVARYTGYQNALRMVAMTLAGAVRVTDKIKVGAGAIRYMVYDYGQSFNYPNAAILSAAAPDGRAISEFSGSGWGFNLGTLIQPLPHHKLGVSFRSKADVEVDGRVVIEDIVLGAAQGYPSFPYFETGAHSNLPLPWNITAAYAYEPSDRWAVEMDLGVTGWEVFTDQDVEFDQPTALLRTLGTTPRNYDNTISLHLGGHYRLNQKTDLLGGFAFYQAAAPKRHVDNFLPDANRWLWTLGTSYNWTPHFRMDLTYIFQLFARRSISNPGVLAKTGTSIDGRYTSIVHGAMVTFNYEFDFPGDIEKKAPDKSIERENAMEKAIIIPQAPVRRPAAERSQTGDYLK